MCYNNAAKMDRLNGGRLEVTTAVLFYGWILVTIVIDQWVKYYVRTSMEIGESVPLIEHVVNLTSHRNYGAAFGILQGQTWFFLMTTVIVLVAVFYYRRRGEFQGRPLLETGVALLAGGAIGNAIDRAVFGNVTDFFDLQFMNYAIFNVADVAINVGVGLMLLSFVLDALRQKRAVR
jgi:signal peptidase II